MFAGVRGGGADAAWLSTALNQEQAHLELAEYLFGLLDIFKCFDQLRPLLIHTMLALAGMPTRVLWAYMRLMRAVQVRNCPSVGVGRPYKRRFSIPQGCPFSMAALALITYPWITMLKQSYHVIPRCLADDLSVWARSVAQVAGNSELDVGWQDEWRLAMQATLEYLEDMGSRPAHSKSLL